jgi:hypothetical protein
MSMIVNSIKMFYNKYQFGFFINHELRGNNNEYIIGYQGMGNSYFNPTQLLTRLPHLIVFYRICRVRNQLMTFVSHRVP